ncbi:sulfotransferase domain-containing protein [Antarctobacter heliothermus]|uniref:Aryl sulfotransferase n=1 Tax=Antarctobacter heliothermus TaxID=74033 RepID=A0A239C2K0_9RHOB|nr:sulfotransferase domain-containing protein [Antarctobacter heliothermus]SNS14396.1 aryl sulfotransferase [Antarctobacter heliothermus]
MTAAPPEPALRDYKDTLTDSRRWGAFTPRDGDIVVSTPPKCGTTWTQGILAMLIAGDPLVDAKTSMKSPWVDICIRDVAEVMARLEAQDHRRQVKTHTPFDGVPYWPQMRYITVYRHPIDVHFSYRKHVANMSVDFAADLFPDDLSRGFRLFLDGDHIDAVSLEFILTHYRETLAREPRENILRLHYADMTRDLPRTVARIAKHVGIDHPQALLDAIADAATFDSMKSNAHRFTPSAGQEFWRNDAEFFNTASSNKWEGKLSPEDLAAYDARMAAALSPEDRRWLEWGSA